MPTVTLDPIYNSLLITLSNGNLTVTNRNASSWYPSRTTSSFSAGKLYFEVTCNTSNSTGAQVGIFNAAAPWSNYLGSDNNGIGYQSSGSVAFNFGSLGNIGSWTTGDTLCVAFDCINQKVWFRKNGGSWDNTTHDPATNTGGYSVASVFGSAVYPAACTYSSGDQLTVNFGATAFAQVVPAGFASPNGSTTTVASTAGQMTQTPSGNPQWRATNGAIVWGFQAPYPPQTNRPHTGYSYGTYRDWVMRMGFNRTQGIGGWHIKVPRDPGATWFVTVTDDSSDTAAGITNDANHPPAGVK